MIREIALQLMAFGIFWGFVLLIAYWIDEAALRRERARQPPRLREFCEELLRQEERNRQ